MTVNRGLKRTITIFLISIGLIVLTGLALIWIVYPSTRLVMFARPIPTEELFALAAKHEVGIFMLYTSYRLGTETFTEMKLFSPDEAYSINKFNHEEFRQDLIESRRRSIADFKGSRKQVLNPPDEGTSSEQWQVDLENWFAQTDSPSRSITDVSVRRALLSSAIIGESVLC